jgi:hypothetical protein
MFALHVEPLEPEKRLYLIAYVWQDKDRQDNLIAEYPGTVVVPARFVELHRLEPGDAMTWFGQKTKSQHHARKSSR